MSQLDATACHSSEIFVQRISLVTNGRLAPYSGFVNSSEKYLANEFAYATECNLATLEELQDLKSSSKSRIARQQGICDRMLRTCLSYKEFIDLPEWGCRTPRVKEHLQSYKEIDK